MSGSDARLRLSGLLLDIRESIGFIEHSLDDGVMFYLSLHDDEISDRFNAFNSRAGIAFAGRRKASMSDLLGIAGFLELSDAVVLRGDSGNIAVMRAGACSFPLFWTSRESTVRISTRLPVRDGQPLSKTGLLSAMTASCLEGSYEPNAWTESPLHAWRRIRRASISIFENSALIDERIIRVGCIGTCSPIDTKIVLEEVRNAFAAYGQSQRHVASSVLELSGGFDSTLAGACAKTPHHVMHGISVEFPYYEFRFESDTQSAVARALGIQRTVLDGKQLFPYAPSEHSPRFDEPSVFVTGIRHAELVASFARNNGVAKIYTGHGGDQLFSTDLTGYESVSSLPSKALFDRSAWCAVTAAVAKIKQPTWRHRATGCFVNDARQDVWTKETFGPVIRTPFSDLAVFRAAHRWSMLSARGNTRPNKTILAEGFPDLLPEAVIRRKGKVAYDGVWMRAYATQYEHIFETLDRASGVLNHLGISTAWLFRRAQDLRDWKDVSGRDLLAAFALSVWLNSWGIERVSDVDWA